MFTFFLLESNWLLHKTRSGGFHFIMNPGAWRIVPLPGRKRNVAIDFTGTDAQSKEEALGEAGHRLASPGCHYLLRLWGRAGGAVPPRVGILRSPAKGCCSPRPSSRAIPGLRRNGGGERSSRFAAVEGCRTRCRNTFRKGQKQNRGADRSVACAPRVGSP